MLLANAIVNIAGKNGNRKVKLEDFILGLGKIDLKFDELIYSFELEDLSEYKTRFFKIGRRKALAISRLNFAVALKKNDKGEVLDIRIVVGAATPVTKRYHDIEEKLKGKKLDDNLIAEVSKEISDQVVAVTGRRKSSEYKLPVIEKVVKKLIKELEEE